MAFPTRRAVLPWLMLLPGCATLTALDGAARPLPTYDLIPVPGGQGRRRGVALAVVLPSATAALRTDRILVRPDPLSVAYLPEARWSDEVPSLVQSLVVRSIAGTDRLGYVGPAEGGPTPDVALLLRIDAFEAQPITGGEGLASRVSIAATLIRDRDQALLSSRTFAGSAVSQTDDAQTVVAAFQAALDGVLPALSDWTAARV
ncbi:ABC-type transport auxiliary lipoprotein family protein [Jannaschia aquimarina]|uniref:ABC-type transport auxiliary lipoprotein component domain-containing protein n=1 Tax=Jannaschia aquimarina TaxID=935700 RepID=A0A0D1E9K6_9RHOB|nr:ABC-type transport auxiliary lipoprotein family protein [Jannaschia aquimarina]KIT14324.1 hypothetical protein jaqu_39140 [Jannaschia aquimarina]SNS86104.1 cholesterol transport system auxiliary component [Jannaschia aquimarina]